jgi:hypothetical protein
MNEQTATAAAEDAARADGPPLTAALFQMTTGTMVSRAISVTARLGVVDALGAVVSAAPLDTATYWNRPGCGSATP